MWLILSPKLEGFRSPDNWTADLEKADPFDSKNDALDFVRADIAKDQDAKIIPRFTGCRVAELRACALARLRKLGFHVSDAFALDVGKVDPAIARTWPRQMFGFSLSLVRDRTPISWEPPRPWSRPRPTPKKSPKKSDKKR